MTFITVYSSKGGVAKTTTAVALGSALANYELTTLVDLDPNGQVGLHFGLQLWSGVYHWLAGTYTLDQCLVAGRPDKLRVLLGDTQTRVAQRWFQDYPDSLCQKFGDLPGRFVVFDTGGTGGLLQETAIRVADIVVIPFLCEGAGADGLYLSMQTVARLAPQAHTILLPVVYVERWNVHRTRLRALQEEMPSHAELSEENAIRARVAVKDGVDRGETVWELKGSGIEGARVGYSLLVSRLLSLAELEVAG